MRKLARDMLWMGAATGASRLLGLFRDVAIASRFGMSASYDAFLIAFFVPHFLRQLLAEGALSTARGSGWALSHCSSALPLLDHSAVAGRFVFLAQLRQIDLDRLM